MLPDIYDVAIVGAGPIGIACAVALQRAGKHCMLIDSGCLCESLYRYPRHMVFFSTAAKIAIPGYPFACTSAKPTRDEALAYYREVALSTGVDLLLYHAVSQIDGIAGALVLYAGKKSISAKQVVIATGFFHQPVPVPIPGADLPHVSHYFSDGHRHAGQDLVIVGGANSAVIAALEAWRCGARVRLVHRRAALKPSVKYWLRPDLENRIAAGEIQACFNSEIESIGEADVVVRNQDERRETFPADQVLLLTGYRGNFAWLQQLGIALNEHHQPLIDQTCNESHTRPGIFLAGCVLCGDKTSDIFIENGLIHAEVICQHLSRSWETSSDH